MKKRLLPILLLILSMLFTGCTSTQLEFWAKKQELNNWAASETKGTINMNMNIQGEIINMVIDMDKFTNTKDMSGYANMSVKGSMLSGQTQNFEIKDIQMYIKEGKVAISKNYFIELFKIAGVDAPSEIANIDADFITLTGADVQTEILLALAKDPNAQKEMYKMIEDAGIDIEITKKDNTYSIDLDQTEIFELLKKVMLTGTDNLGTFNEKFALGLTEAKIKDVQTQMNEVKPQFDQIFTMASSMLKGSFKMDYIFEDTKVIEKMSFTVSDPILTNRSMDMKIDMTAARAEVKEIVIPGKVVEISQEDFMKMAGVSVVLIDKTEGVMTDALGNQTACKTIVKNDKTFVPAKAVLGALGKEVVYDNASKKVGIQAEDTFKALNTIIEQGTSYMSLDELKALGFSVEVVGNLIQIQ